MRIKTSHLILLGALALLLTGVFALHGCGAATTSTLSTLDPSTGVFPNPANIAK
ncbi:MAG: hypothetical protein ACXWP5_04425 [Bdellovibrionota bacterium]